MISNLIAYVGSEVEVTKINLFNGKKTFVIGKLEAIGPDAIVVDAEIHYLEEGYEIVDKILVNNVDIFKRNMKAR